jgi:hypothetical protein
MRLTRRMAHANLNNPVAHGLSIGRHGQRMLGRISVYGHSF